MKLILAKSINSLSILIKGKGAKDVDLKYVQKVRTVQYFTNLGSFKNTSSPQPAMILLLGIFQLRLVSFLLN